jgi:hypothetical protein
MTTSALLVKETTRDPTTHIDYTWSLYIAVIKRLRTNEMAKNIGHTIIDPNGKSEYKKYLKTLAHIYIRHTSGWQARTHT